MKVKKSTVDDVKARFAFKKLEKEREKKEKQIEAMLEDVHEEEARMKDSKKASLIIFFKLSPSRIKSQSNENGKQTLWKSETSTPTYKL